MSNASGSLNRWRIERSGFCLVERKSADPAAFLKLSRRMTLVWGGVLILFGLLPWGHLLEAGLRVASLPSAACWDFFCWGRLIRGRMHGIAGGKCSAGLASVLLVWATQTLRSTCTMLIGSLVTFVLGAAVSRLFAQRARLQLTMDAAA